MRAPLAGVAAVWLALAAAPAAGISDASGLCGAADDPCVVFATIPVDDGAMLDLGARTLEVISEGRLDVGSGTMTISAGAIVLRANGRLAGAGGKIFLESGFSTETIRDLTARGHAIHFGRDGFGGYQAIQRGNGVYVGASESRKDGQAAGY